MTLLDELTELMSKGPDERFELEKMLAFMQKHGSSITINYGEDTGAWEVCWITGGKRFRSTPSTTIFNGLLWLLSDMWKRLIADEGAKQ